MRRLLVLTMILAATAASAEFRGIEWGTPRAEVVETVGEDYFKETEKRLFYNREILGSEAMVLYEFEDGLLRSGSISFDALPHDRIARALRERYGRPDEVNREGGMYWIDRDGTHVMGSPIPEIDSYMVQYLDAEYQRRAREEQAKRDAGEL
jgi:hypothetical protein